MFFLGLVCLVAVFYFPVVWISGKVAGERGQTAAIVLMVAGTLAFVLGIPVSFFLFLRYGL